MDTIDKILAIPKDQLIKPEFGSASLKDWQYEYGEIIKKLRFVNEYWDKVDDHSKANIQNAVGNILSWFSEMVRADEGTFVNKKSSFKEAVRASFDIIKQNYPVFFITALDQIDFADIIGYKNQLEKSIQENTELAFNRINELGQKIIESSKEQAGRIENRVRDSAKGISVTVAQEQFNLGAKTNLIQIGIWGGITLILIAVIGYWIWVMLNIKVPPKWNWQFIYESIVRIIIIGFSSTLLAFTLRMLKSNLHLREHNLHRLRVSNSMQAFVESATEQNQRDIILAKLIDSVVDFGNSGLIDGYEEKDSKITIESLTGALSNLKS